MARQLLPAGTTAGVTGIWVSTSIGRRRAAPYRVMAVSQAGTWTTGSIEIDELIGGLPGSQSLYGVAHSPLGPNADTGTPNQLGTIAPPTAGVVTDLQIDYPVEWMRAKTPAGMTGTVGVWVETLE